RSPPASPRAPSTPANAGPRAPPPPPPRRCPGATAARAACGPAAAHRPPPGTAWGPPRQSGCPAPRPAPPPRSSRRLPVTGIRRRRRRAPHRRTLHHPVEGFPRPDHPQLAARPLLHRRLAGGRLQVGYLRGQRCVAFAQPVVLVRLLRHLVLELGHLPRASGAEPQPV